MRRLLIPLTTSNALTGPSSVWRAISAFEDSPGSAGILKKTDYRDGWTMAKDRPVPPFGIRSTPS